MYNYTQIVKRNVLENIVPIIISCKHYLEQARSPLLMIRDLLAYVPQEAHANKSRQQAPMQIYSGTLRSQDNI